MKPHLARRVASLQQAMQAAGLDAVVFSDRENLIYYTGAVAIECMAVVIPASGEAMFCCLWLDEPYVRNSSGSDRVMAYHFPASNIGEVIVQALRSLGLSRHRVGFHKYFVEFSVFTALREAFSDMEWHPAADLTYKVRSVKDADELRCIKMACSYVDIGMQAAFDAARPGITEVELLAEAEYVMRKAGSEGSTFRMQVLTWPKQFLAHPFAGNTVITNNQPVVIHLGASCEGYTAKMCRTVFLGDVSDETPHIYTVLATAQEIALGVLRPGVTSAEIYDVVMAYLAGQGYAGRFLDILGYGVGIRQSEFYPVIGKGIPHVLEENMVVDLLLSTIFTQNGGPRITDMVHVKGSTAELLTTFSRAVHRK